MRVLGIELTATRVRAVEIERSLGRYDIQDYHESPVEPPETPAQVASRLILSLPKKPDKIAVALPQKLVTARNASFPTKKKDMIQNAVGFELEDELPFDLDHAIHDHSIISQVKSISNVHIEVTLKKHLEEFIQSLKAAELDPEIITTEAWAFRTFFQRSTSKAAQEFPVLLAHIGATHSHLYIHQKGGPVLSRELKWGYDNLTQAISVQFSISMADAEKVRNDSSAILSEEQKAGATPEQLALSDALLGSLRKLAVEIRQFNLSCKTLVQDGFQEAYLSGGPVLLSGFREALERELGIPVKNARGLSALSPSGISFSDSTDAYFLLPGALALVAAGIEKAPPINFRKEEFKKQLASGPSFQISSIRGPLAAVSTVFACFLLSMILQASIYGSRVKEINSQIDRNLKTLLPRASNKASLISRPAALKKEIENKLKFQRELASLYGKNPHAPLQFLKSLSQRVDKGITLDMIQFTVGSAPDKEYQPAAKTTASLTFLVMNPQMAERLEKALKDLMPDLQKGKTEEAPALDGTGTRMKVTFTGTPKEDSYGT